MKRVYELLEEMKPMKEEAKRRAVKYITDRVRKAGDIISFIDDERGDYYGGVNVLVTYDGGRHPECNANPYAVVNAVYMKNGKLYVDCEGCDEFSFDRLEWGDVIDIADYLYQYIPEDGYNDDVAREEVVAFFKENGTNLFGNFTETIADIVADEVVEEYNEAGDGDLQKAITYVIGDKFGLFDGV